MEDAAAVNADCDPASVVSTLSVLSTLVCSASDTLVTRSVEGVADGAAILDTMEMMTTT